MHKHNFGYFFREGVANMFSHGFMTFAAIGITVACLLIMGTFTLVAVNANAMLEDMEERNQVLAFVQLDMSEEEARAISPHTQYVMETLTATTPDRKIAKIYMDVDNYGGGEGVPVILEIQKPDGIHGFKRDEKETVLPKDASFNVVRNYMEEGGVAHISLCAKKSKRMRTKA